MVKRTIYNDKLTIYTEYKKAIIRGHKRMIIPKDNLIFDTVEEAMQYMEQQENKKTPQEIIDSKVNKRVKERIKEVIRSNIGAKSYFLTLTFAQEITSYKEALEYWKKFIRRFKKQFKYDLKYLCVVEIQEQREIKYGQGVIHFHTMLFNGRYVKDLKWLESIWAHGTINYKKIHDWSEPERVSNYFGKYLTKQNIAGKKYFTSRNIKKPQVDISCDFEINEFMEALQSPQAKIKTTNKPHAYIYTVETTT